MTAALQLSYVPERDDAFLALFPHRFDYIYAEHPRWGERPHWQTERRHPLSDRLLLQPTRLYGVRFGRQTHYCLLDLDRGSPYHPQTHPQSTARLLAALEPLGLVTPVACTSSHSGGIHLYFPLQTPQRSWELALAVAATLENAGFPLQPGQLELFPNPKPYRSGEIPTLFNAHRLPMQPGSYLLNADWQPLWSDRSRFAQQWQLAQSRNSIDQRILQRLRQRRYPVRRLSSKADKFLADLDAEIETGWTSFGQTNYLLGRIALRAYIFHSVTTGEPPLTGQALVDVIIAIAHSLPGYSEWCRHQHDLPERAAEWARCVENSHYFPYGTSKGKYKSASTIDQPVSESESWNQKQTNAARERIRAAIADLLEQNALPSGATARFQKLTQYGIGGGSLYKHRDLWHPNSLTPESSSPITSEPASANTTSLLPQTARNSLCDQALADVESEIFPPLGRNGLSALDHQPDAVVIVNSERSCICLPFVPRLNFARRHHSTRTAELPRSRGCWSLDFMRWLIRFSKHEPP